MWALRSRAGGLPGILARGTSSSSRAAALNRHAAIARRSPPRILHRTLSAGASNTDENSSSSLYVLAVGGVGFACLLVFGGADRSAPTRCDAPPLALPPSTAVPGAELETPTPSTPQTAITPPPTNTHTPTHTDTHTTHPPRNGKKKRVVVLGSGWAAASFLKKIDRKEFDVTCVSPRNYFLMTPLLPSVTVGTVETRTVIEPMRSLVGPDLRFLEAECVSIDHVNKRIRCSLPYSQNTTKVRPPAERRLTMMPHKQQQEDKKQHWWKGKSKPEKGLHLRTHSRTAAPVPPPPPQPEPAPVQVVAERPIIASSSRTVKDSARTRPPFELEYDVLIVAIGADNNTFNTPGVKEHAHFLKELPDAQRIRHAISDCFESAVLPNQTPEEIQRLLRFVVVGGGPTGVEYAAELADLLRQDMKTYFGKLATETARVVVIEAMDHVLSMMDKKLQEHTEKHLQAQNIEVMPNTFVKGVKQTEVLIQRKGKTEVESLPCAVVVWATGIKPRDFAQEIRKNIGLHVQNNSRGILTDAFMRIKGADGMYAVGDCATIEQPRIIENLAQHFKDALRNSEEGGLTLDDFREFLSSRNKQYPQLEFLIDRVEKVFNESDVNRDGRLDLEEFTKLMEKTDNKVRALPATAQVANQQGKYLARVLNSSLKEGARIKPFTYRHLGSLAYIGGDSAVADFTGSEKFLNFFELHPMGGFGTWLVWRGFYLTEMFTLRTKILLASDWLRCFTFGRDISRY